MPWDVTKASAVQDPSGGAAEEALSRVLQRWGDQLSSSKGRSELHNPLSMGEALPLLPLSRSLFAGAQPAGLVQDMLMRMLSGKLLDA